MKLVYEHRGTRIYDLEDGTGTHREVRAETLAVEMAIPNDDETVLDEEVWVNALTEVARRRIARKGCALYALETDEGREIRIEPIPTFAPYEQERRRITVTLGYWPWPVNIREEPSCG